MIPSNNIKDIDSFIQMNLNQSSLINNNNNKPKQQLQKQQQKNEE
jgi:hypothetical protein